IGRAEDEPERRRRVWVLLQPGDWARQHDLDRRQKDAGIPLPSRLTRDHPKCVGRLAEQELGDEVEGEAGRKEQEDELLSAHPHAVSVSAAASGAWRLRGEPAKLRSSPEQRTPKPFTVAPIRWS